MATEADVLALVIATFRGDVQRSKAYGWWGRRGHKALADHLIKLGWRNSDFDAARTDAVLSAPRSQQ